MRRAKIAVGIEGHAAASDDHLRELTHDVLRARVLVDRDGSVGTPGPAAGALRYA